MAAAGMAPELSIIPAVDLIGAAEKLQRRCTFIAAFPEQIPQTDNLSVCWEGLQEILEPGGIALITLPSAEAERFDRKKLKDFSRIGDIKRKGFRALAYQKN
jgi:hypothetical protein